jgi:hypothetical protein
MSAERTKADIDPPRHCRPVTGDDGKTGYISRTRARVTSIIYFSVTTCHQGDVGRPGQQSAKLPDNEAD